MRAAYPDIALIVPARNEEHSLPGVLGKVPPEISQVVLVSLIPVIYRRFKGRQAVVAETE